MNEAINYISKILPEQFEKYIESIAPGKREQIKELRMRSQRPLCIDYGNGCLFANDCPYVTPADINFVMAQLSDYSMNSIRNKLSKGFITLRYGCRVGIAGEAVIKNGQIEFQRNINGINIRLARECIGCSQKVITDIYNGKRIYNTLIISPPLMGKTTLLRDIARSLGKFVNVTIIDERSEIASCYNGTAQFNVGERTDVLDCCPKPEGISMAVRSLSPQVIVTDEIGNDSDCNALAEAAKCGVSFVTTMHADSICGAQKRKCANVLFESGLVQRAILLGNSNGIGTVEQIQKL